MVIVSKHIRYAIPDLLASHMAKTWRVGVPYEKPVYVLEFVGGDLDLVKAREVEVDTFAGRVTERVV